MVTLVLTYHGVDVNQSPQLTVPVLVANFGSYTFKGGTYGDVEFPTEPQDQSTVDQFLGRRQSTPTPWPAGRSRARAR